MRRCPDTPVGGGNAPKSYFVKLLKTAKKRRKNSRRRQKKAKKKKSWSRRSLPDSSCITYRRFKGADLRAWRLIATMNYGRPPPDVEGMVSLKVDNLTYRTAPETLRRVFEKYGRVGDVYIPRDRYTKESRGFAFVRFFDKRDAEDAMDAMDGALLDGRELRVQMARYGRPPDSHYGGGRRGPPKKHSGRRSRRYSMDV